MQYAWILILPGLDSLSAAMLEGNPPKKQLRMLASSLATFMLLIIRETQDFFSKRGKTHLALYGSHGQPMKRQERLAWGLAWTEFLIRDHPGAEGKNTERAGGFRPLTWA